MADRSCAGAFRTASRADSRIVPVQRHCPQGWPRRPPDGAWIDASRPLLGRGMRLRPRIPRTGEGRLARCTLARHSARRRGCGLATRDTRNVPKEQASGLGGRSLRTRPVRVAEATGAGAGTSNRNQVNRCRLPLRDDHSMPGVQDETQYHLSPNFGAGGEAIHTPSTARPTAPTWFRLTKPFGSP